VRLYTMLVVRLANWDPSLGRRRCGRYFGNA
jgi:hypothetical protein